jgi:hypothetical protein
MVVGGVEEDLGWQTAASGDKFRCGGQDGHRSGPGKVDDDADEARGRDARILVWHRG